MNTDEIKAQNFCREFLDDLAKKYDFTYDIVFNKRFTRVFGRCRWFRNREKYGIISINYNYLMKHYRINNLEPIKQTLKHEVAHLLTPAHAHDNVWQRKLVEIGGLPQRHTIQTDYKPYRYIYECPHCHKQIKRTKKISSSKQTACGKCCRELNNDKWSEKYVFKLVYDAGKIVHGIEEIA